MKTTSICLRFHGTSTKRASSFDKDLDDGVSCKKCHFNLDAGLHFELQIQSCSILEAAVWVEGDAQAVLDVEASVAQSAVTDEFNLAHVTLKEVCITIASIPFCLDVNMAVDAGYNITVGDEGKVSARIAVEGSIKKGVLYKKSDDNVHRIDQGLLEPKDGHIASIEASASLDLNLFPKIVFAVDHLGGPTFGLRSVLEFVGDMSSSGADCPSPALFGSLSFGIQFSLGAMLHVNIPSVVDWKKEWPAAVLDPQDSNNIWLHAACVPQRPWRGRWCR